MMSCSICCELFDGKRHQIKCNYCASEQCTQCVQTYLLQITDDAHCMTCKHPWNSDFIDATLSKNFRNKELRKHREDILYDREKAMLPATQLLLEADMEKQKLIQLKYDLKHQIDEINARLNNPANFTIKETDKKYTIIRSCPSNDCRGFINGEWQCGMCHVDVCKKCHEIKDKDNDEKHVCKPETLETVKLIAKDSRHCPKCPAIIHKIDGCDQMYCIVCHTAFSFRTGQIDNGKIHNPEYYRWYREHKGELPREAGDVLCGRDEFPDASLLFAKCKHNPQVVNMLPALLHVEHVTLEMVRPETRYNYNQNLRKRYLRKEIDESKFKTLLQRNEKAIMKKQCFYDILQLLLQVSKEAFHVFMESKSNSCVLLIKDVKSIVRYCLGQLAAVDKRFDSNNQTIRDDVASILNIEVL